VVVAAGDGIRFGSKKQFATLAGRPVVSMSVESARSVANGVVLVIPPGVSEAEVETLDPDLVRATDVIVSGGANRADSVRAGLSAVPGHAGVIIIHDAVRPLASLGLFRLVVTAVRDGADGAIPALPVSDTLKRVDAGIVVSTVSRADLVSVQTPQAFRASVLREAHAGSQDATDDAALVESLGATVRIVPGESSNLKLTAPGDLRVLEALLESRPTES
jgi:2-C-methyl-D-erythritol 4-phosphate cytidylyltransferase